MEENKKISPETSAPMPKFKAGEKGFAIFWLIFGGFFFWQSVVLYQKHPGLDSCAAIPLFVTGVIVLCALITILSDAKAPSENSGLSVGEIVQKTLCTMFPIDVLVMMVLIFIYCIALYAGLGFYFSTSVFLWVAMTYFMRNQYLVDKKIEKSIFVKVAGKNILWTALSVVFILLVFTFLFSVVLP